MVVDQPESVWRNFGTYVGCPMPALDPDMPGDLADMFVELMEVWARHIMRNVLRDTYFEGRNKIKDFGISTPPELLSVETVVDWPSKAVTALADRVRFDGFTAADSDVQARLDAMCRRTSFMQRTRTAAVSEGVYGVHFATVGVDADGRARIDYHPATAASAVYDRAKGRIAYGMVVDEFRDGTPVECRVFTDDAVHTLWSDGSYWRWSTVPISMGRVTMEAFSYRPTERKPFGQSRISRAVMSITDSAVRVALGGDVSYQFAVSPQKFFIGAAKNPFEEKTRWEAYIGSMFAAGYNSKDGVMPQFGQLPQASMEPTVAYMRSLATRFAGSTNIPVSQLGIIHDQPASAEAIYAANEPLVIEATDLIDGNRESMKNLARMCVAAELDVPLDELTDEQADVMANYRNPAMPSVVSQADAAVKIAASVPEFAGTPAFWKMLGMPEDTRREIDAEIAAKNAQRLFDAVVDGGLEEGQQAVQTESGGTMIVNEDGTIADDKGDLTRLNGSQMNVLIDLVTQAREGTMTRDQAERLMRVGFKLSDEDIRTLFGGA